MADSSVSRGSILIDMAMSRPNPADAFTRTSLTHTPVS